LARNRIQERMKRDLSILILINDDKAGSKQARMIDEKT
jgi:hypothetical protein